VDPPGRRCPSGCPARCPSSWPVSILKAASVRRGVHRADALTAGVHGVRTGCPQGRATGCPAIRICPGCSACGSARACPSAVLRGTVQPGVRSRPRCPPHAGRVSTAVSALLAPRPYTATTPTADRTAGRLGRPDCPSTTRTRQSGVDRAWTSGGTVSPLIVVELVEWDVLPVTCQSLLILSSAVWQHL